MYCKKCGSEVPEVAEFCPKCGTEATQKEALEAEEAIEEVALGGHPSDSIPIVEDTAADAVAPEADTQPIQPDDNEAKAGAPDGTMPLEGGSAAAAESASPKPRITRRNRPLIIAAAAAVAVIAIAFGAGTWLKSNQEAQAVVESAWEASHVALITQVVAEVPGFDESSTAIPVQIKGTDLDGNEVDEVQYLRPDSMYITTLPGSYDVTFPGGYFTGDGKVIKAPDTTQHIELEAPDGKGELTDQESKTQNSNQSERRMRATDPDNDDAKSTESADRTGKVEDSEGSPSASGESPAYRDDENDDTIYEIPTKLKPIKYVEIPALDVTDELISLIASWAKDDPEDSGKAVTLMEMATTKHVEAVAAEEARKAAEAQAPDTEDTTGTAQSTSTDAPAASTPAAAPQPAAPAVETPAPVVEQPATTTEAPAQTPSTNQDDTYQYYLDQRQRMATG